MLTICISWPLSDKTESSFALYGPLSEQSRRECKILLSFSLTVIKCSNNGSSCTFGSRHSELFKQQAGHESSLTFACSAAQHLRKIHGESLDD